MEEKAFVSSLHSFMKEKGTPIERIPHLGFKQSEFTLLLLLYKHISKMKLEKEVDYSCVCVSPPLSVNLWKIYKAVDKLGGYDSVSTLFSLCNRCKKRLHCWWAFKWKWAVGLGARDADSGAVNTSLPMLCFLWCWHCGISCESETHNEMELDRGSCWPPLLCPRL